MTDAVTADEVVEANALVIAKRHCGWFEERGRQCAPDEGYCDCRETAKLLRTHDAAHGGWRPIAGCNSLATPERVRFYEHDFYVLSNFSAFKLNWANQTFDTSEAAYHWEKFVFTGSQPWQDAVGMEILRAPSAHEAFKIAEKNKALRRVDWDFPRENGRPLKVNIMKAILIAKAQQHEYVRRKLLATGERELVEDSWRDDYWGWGPNQDGKNMLGKLWGEVRSELRALPPSPKSGG